VSYVDLATGPLEVRQAISKVREPTTQAAFISPVVGDVCVPAEERVHPAVGLFVDQLLAGEVYQVSG